MSTNGKLVEAGNLKIFVPENYSVRTGNNMGEPDDNQVWLQTNPPTFQDYYWVILQEDEENLDNNLRMTKDINNGEDIAPFTTANMAWSGVFYDYYDLPCNVLKGANGENCFQVTIIGHRIEDDVVQEVLSSICVK